MAFIFILLTIIFTAYGQLILKNELSSFGVMPTQINLLIPYLLKAFSNVNIILSILSAVLAMVCWFGAVSRLDLSFAYPFMSLTFPVVMFLSILLFNEPFYWTKVVGIMFILIGLIFISLK